MPLSRCSRGTAHGRKIVKARGALDAPGCQPGSMQAARPCPRLLVGAVVVCQRQAHVRHAPELLLARQHILPQRGGAGRAGVPARQATTASASGCGAAAVRCRPSSERAHACAPHRRLSCMSCREACQSGAVEAHSRQSGLLVCIGALSRHAATSGLAPSAGICGAAHSVCGRGCMDASSAPAMGPAAGKHIASMH